MYLRNLYINKIQYYMVHTPVLDLALAFESVFELVSQYLLVFELGLKRVSELFSVSSSMLYGNYKAIL